MHVPAIAAWEGTLSPGKTCMTPASTLELFPACLDISQGKGVAGTFLAENGALTNQPFFYYGPKKLHAVRLGPWKLHVHTSSQTGKAYFANKLPLLFNLEEDPSEQYDLSDVYVNIVDSLSQLIEMEQIRVAKEGTLWD